MAYIAPLRHQPQRSQTWPRPSRRAHPSLLQCTGATSSITTAAAVLDPTNTPKIITTNNDNDDDGYLDLLDNDPASHFLAPVNMWEYEDWASSDTDSDGESDTGFEDFEWDAGITDFSLFTSERRRAEASNEPLPSKWAPMLESQTSALQRATYRQRVGSDVDGRNSDSGLLNADDVPSLTPDTSPSLRDDLDVVESYHGQIAGRPCVPHYLTINIASADDDEDDNDIEDTAEREMVKGAYDQRHDRLLVPVREGQTTQARRRQERPGLRHTRTMSGQEHSWRTPEPDIYTVTEEPDKEKRAEVCCSLGSAVESGDGGRGRDRARR